MLPGLLPWATVTGVTSAKVIDHKRLYVSGAELRQACTQACSAPKAKEGAAS